MKRNLTILIFLFAAQPAFPQFNTIGFQKDLAIVNTGRDLPLVAKSAEFDRSHVAQENERRENFVLASLPLDDFLLTSRFGLRSDPFSGKQTFHRGIDLSTNRSLVYAMLQGIVLAAGYDSLFGNFVKIQHGKYQAIYGHLSQTWVAQGEMVLPGTPLGISGSTGKATGDHLHLSIKKGKEYINPVLFIQLLSKLESEEDIDFYLSNTITATL